MTQFYTKNQMDDLASVIGDNIKNSVTEERIVNALMFSEYSLLSNTEIANLLTKQDMVPATNIDSFILALNTITINLSELSNIGRTGQWISSYYSDEVDPNALPGEPNYFINLYSNRVIEELNVAYPTYNLLRSEVNILYEDTSGNYITTPAEGITRITGQLIVRFEAPL